MVNGANGASVFIARNRFIDARRNSVPALGKVEIDWLHNTEEQQPDTDTRGKHHRDPVRIGIVGVASGPPIRTLPTGSMINARQNKVIASTDKTRNQSNVLVSQGLSQPKSVAAASLLANAIRTNA